MKTSTKHTNKEIELPVWQLLTLIVAGIACLFATAPVISRYRSSKCGVIYIDNPITAQSNNSEAPLDSHPRYVREVALRDQCGIIPPMCSATPTAPTVSSTSPVITTRTTLSPATVTRPVITTYPTSPRTTTPDPWANSTRPYNSWRLPVFATPISYTLRLTCPDCFTLISNSSTIAFNGQVTIRMNIQNPTEYLVLHAKNLNITQAILTNGTTDKATITYLPEFEMVYLFFGPSTLTTGEKTIQIDYTGVINQQDQTGFYRESFWKSIGELSYLLAANFQPVHARRAFPCFDEPNMPATFSLTLDHPQNSTIALSNNPAASQTGTSTTFETTSVLSTYLFAWAVLPLDEFKLVSQNISDVTVNIWIRPELSGLANANLDWTFEVIKNTFQFIEDHLNITSTMLPKKLDIIGVPDLILDESASSSWGLLTFREELLCTDESLNSAERIQSTTKTIVEHILQIWFSKTDWWNNIWFGKSLSSFLAYKVIEEKYLSFNFMEQFPIREMVPLMMDDSKPSIWPVSNQNLTNNEEILDYLSPRIYSKGAALLRLLEYIVSAEAFETAVTNLLSISDASTVLNSFYSNFDFNATLNTTVTVAEFVRSWVEERNYPIVTIDLIRSNDNDTIKNTTLVFRQSRYLGSPFLDSSTLDPNYTWKIYMECQLGGLYDGVYVNLTANLAPSPLKFIFESSTETIVLPDVDYLWIKCNKDFYSYQVTEYVSYGGNQNVIWQFFQLIFNEDILSNNDKANLLNDVFILPHGGEIVTYDQTIDLVRVMYRNPAAYYLPWSVFVWHWNYLMGVEEHSRYFGNFKQFATRQVLAPFSFDINNIVTVGTSHQERLLKSMFFDLLCRVQNTDSLNKATELFRRIPASYFYNSSGVTNVPADYLSTAIYYHIQNINDKAEWDYLWANLTENEYITSQQRHTFLRALGASKEIWRLKLLLERSVSSQDNLIETQEFFDVITSISQNPIGRDIVWNAYRHYHQDLINRFGSTNRLFNQLIADIAQSFETEFYYAQMTDFIDEYPSSSKTQQLAVDQILMNFEWLQDGLAKNLDDAISGGDRLDTKINLN